MIPSDRVRILIATKPVDFRKSHDGLAVLVQSVLKEDPFAGAVFVFRSKRMDRLKLLFWEFAPVREAANRPGDGSRQERAEPTGLVMAYKRLEESGFVWPPVTDGVMSLNRAQFEAL
ncbi:IS66 family insertion sequence element accessory protein TnpB, partial [Poseidonocella sp. HB161398]|uniref:IS66 family insertion sequence element accessory protein TnpB n=1 Tax=Poseidonocella sp. HB161398 TaxID=2320855 RepID=UPI001108AF35